MLSFILYYNIFILCDFHNTILWQSEGLMYHRRQIDGTRQPSGRRMCTSDKNLISHLGVRCCL
jgi:hypothetical protein